MSVITLTTDFGTDDYEAGVLKGVIWAIAPQARIADLTHAIARHQILEAALLLWRSIPYFPAGSVHLVVVDPGVGTSRRGLAARLGEQFVVAPDNGLISLVLARAEDRHERVEIVHLTRPEYWLPHVSPVFHGRDIFAPVAAHLANGVPLSALGAPIQDPVRLTTPLPQRTSQGWRTQVVHVDHFGNLATLLQREQLPDSQHLIIHVGAAQIHGLVRTFGDRPPGELVALFDSSGCLAVSRVNGNAAEYLGVSPGDWIEVIYA